MISFSSLPVKWTNSHGLSNMTRGFVIFVYSDITCHIDVDYKTQAIKNSFFIF